MIAGQEEIVDKKARNITLLKVSPFLKSFRFGRAILRDYFSRSTKNWH
jgi:hypothetical protein